MTNADIYTMTHKGFSVVEPEQFDPEGYLWMREEKTSDWGLYAHVGTYRHDELESIEAKPMSLYPPYYQPRFGAAECVPFRVGDQVFAWRSQVRWALTRLA